MRRQAVSKSRGRDTPKDIADRNWCPSLALAEMKLLLRGVYSKFSTTPDPSMRAKDMEMSDQLISSRPLGEKCLLRFTPIGSKGRVND